MEHELFYTKNINIYEEKYYINVKYPYTIYSDINEYIDKNIQQYIKDFEVIIKSNEDLHERYFLNIYFETLDTNKYLNFIFYIQKNIGGLHPESSIFTISIDKQTKKIITIEDLKNEYDNYLEKISNICYKQLKELKNIQEYGAYTMLEYGTKGIDSNYSDFIIMNNTIEIIFEHSKVAPYSLGVFNVIISKKELI